jgi:hypothetical protein
MAGGTVGIESAIADVYRDQAEALREQIRLLDERQAEAEATMAFREREAEWIQQNKEAELEAIRERSEMMAQLREEERAYRAAEMESLRNKVADMQGYAGAFVSVGSAIGGVFGQLAEREEEGSEAAKRYGKIQGGIMAAMAFIQSAIEYAAGIGAIATQNYVSAAAHFAAGIAYDVAGAMAIAQLGGDAAPASTGGGTSAASFVPEQGRADEGTGQPSGAVIQVYTMGGTSARLGQEMQRAERQLSRSGLDSPMFSGGGWS